jgi:UDP-N-acetylglucosamine 1-carboxyvinyltransferase
MFHYYIEGGIPLKGKVRISGSKNASLPILAASLLTAEPCTLNNVPDLKDIQTMIALLTQIGKRVEFDSGTIRIYEDSTLNPKAEYDIVKQMRASIAVLGPLLARYKKANVSLPGGCSIGSRPVDLHIKGMEALGAEIELNHGYIKATATALHGTKINLTGKFGPTVLGTDNVMMAASLIEDETIIQNAALEPEVDDVIAVLRKMGAVIERKVNGDLVVIGKKQLSGFTHDVIPDRIEAGTFAILGAIPGNNLQLEGLCSDHLESLFEVLKLMGVQIEKNDNSLNIFSEKRITPHPISTAPYPGFPTDLQAQMMVLLTQANGKVTLTENIFPDRFMHVDELNRMGADLEFNNQALVYISGPKSLLGTQVMASDLRAGAALVIAALAAKGPSIVRRVYHIERGYEHFPAKLRALGAKIEKIWE